MIFFSGFGILTPLVGVVGFVIGAIIASLTTSDRNNLTYLYIVCGVVSGVLCWWVGSRINDPKKTDRVMIDKATGREVRLRRRHTFMFVPMEWWGPVFFCLCIILALTGYAPPEH